MFFNCGIGEDSWEFFGLQEIQPVHSKGNQSWIFTEGLIWSWSSNTLATWCEELTHWKRPWCWERLKAGGEGDNRDKMVGWHHWLNGHEFEQVPGDGDWQGSLACCSSWSHKVSHTTERLNNSNECYFVNKSFKPEKKVKTFSKTWGQIHNIFQRKFSSDSIWIMVAV